MTFAAISTDAGIRKMASESGLVMIKSGSIKRLPGYVAIVCAALAAWTTSIAAELESAPKGTGPFSLMQKLEQPPAAAQQPETDEQETVTVGLTSGRRLTGTIDQRTDGEQLWLRWESARAELLRPIDWDSVVTVEINGEQISGEEILELVRQIRRETPAQPASAPAVNTIVMIGTPSAEGAYSSSANYRQAIGPTAVHWLDIHARPGRWDSYVEPDGMLICIAPKDASNDVVPVRGTLDVDLIAEHTGVVRLQDPFRRIGHWSQAVRVEDFGPYGAWYRLPFQDLNPEFKRDLGPHGAIHATLSIPGQGTFAATADTRIRPYSLIRDRLEQTTGQRFFPEETVGQPWDR
jgi:hypothetical protein